jgi:excisionase family DNA binding protein
MTHTAATADDQYWTIAEVAARLRVSKMTVYRLTDTGQLPGTIRVGRAFRIPGSALNAYLKASVIS